MPYMPLECGLSSEHSKGFDNKVFPTQDIYALGVCIVEMLTGQPYFLSTDQKIRHKNFRMPRINESSELNQEMVLLVDQCMDNVPSRRPGVEFVIQQLKHMMVMWDQMQSGILTKDVVHKISRVPKEEKDNHCIGRFFT